MAYSSFQYRPHIILGPGFIADVYNCSEHWEIIQSEIYPTRHAGKKGRGRKDEFTSTSNITSESVSIKGGFRVSQGRLQSVLAAFQRMNIVPTFEDRRLPSPIQNSAECGGYFGVAPGLLQVLDYLRRYSVARVGVETKQEMLNLIWAISLMAPGVPILIQNTSQSHPGYLEERVLRRHLQEPVSQKPFYYKKSKERIIIIDPSTLSYGAYRRFPGILVVANVADDLREQTWLESDHSRMCTRSIQVPLGFWVRSEKRHCFQAILGMDWTGSYGFSDKQAIESLYGPMQYLNERFSPFLVLMVHASFSEQRVEGDSVESNRERISNNRARNQLVVDLAQMVSRRGVAPIKSYSLEIQLKQLDNRRGRCAIIAESDEHAKRILELSPPGWIIQSLADDGGNGHLIVTLTTLRERRPKASTWIRATGGTEPLSDIWSLLKTPSTPPSLMIDLFEHGQGNAERHSRVRRKGYESSRCHVSEIKDLHGYEITRRQIPQARLARGPGDKEA